MKINTYIPHIIVLPEDRANEEIANGFIQAPKVNYNIIQVERPAGGWTKVLDKFTENHIPELRIYSQRMIVLLIDFDKNNELWGHDLLKHNKTELDRIILSFRAYNLDIF